MVNAHLRLVSYIVRQRHNSPNIRPYANRQQLSAEIARLRGEVCFPGLPAILSCGLWSFVGHFSRMLPLPPFASLRGGRSVRPWWCRSSALAVVRYLASVLLCLASAVRFALLVSPLFLLWVAAFWCSSPIHWRSDALFLLFSLRIAVFRRLFVCFSLVAWLPDFYLLWVTRPPASSGLRGCHRPSGGCSLALLPGAAPPGAAFSGALSTLICGSWAVDAYKSPGISAPSATLRSLRCALL